MASDEKPSSKALNDREKSFASVDEYSDDNFNEPAVEETLHRGLKARQIFDDRGWYLQTLSYYILKQNLHSLAELLGQD